MSAKVNRAITLEEGRSPERANRRHSGSCASRSRSRSDWRRASSANPIFPSEPRRKMRCNADQLAHRLRTKPPRPTQLAGKNCRFFPSKREFRRFSPRNRRLAAKMVQKIKSLLANSHGEASREFASAEPGIKLAEPGNYRESVRAPASSTTAEHQKRTRKKHIS